MTFSQSANESARLLGAILAQLCRNPGDQNFKNTCRDVLKTRNLYTNIRAFKEFDPIFEKRQSKIKTNEKLKFEKMEVDDICCICNKKSNGLSLGKLGIVHQDGTLLYPIETLAKLARDDYITKNNTEAPCCPDCAKDLQNLAILERDYQKLKSVILSRLKSLEKDQKPVIIADNRKRKRTKTRKHDGESQDESEESDTEADTAIKVEEIEVSENVPDETFKAYAKDRFPKCSLSRISGNKISCLSKSCRLELSYQMLKSETSKKMLIMAKGSSCHEDNEDPNRVIFEMTKSEFLEEFICEFCCQRFESDESLASHHRQEDETMFKCPLCKSKCKTFHARNLHFLMSHCSDRPYKCMSKDCSKAFKTKYKLAAHESSCVHNVRFPCVKCEKTFTCQRNLNDHCKVIHDRDPQLYQFQCAECQKRFYKKCNYESHLISHRTTNDKLNCSHCGLQFKRMRSLKSHMDLKHAEHGVKKAYLCPICGHCLESYTGYRQHLAKHTGTVYIKRNYKCLECQKSFRSPADLRTHQVVHTKTKAFACDLCNAMFTQKASLKDHYNVHLKKFVCRVCDKAFGRQRYLENHEKICGHSTTTATVNKNEVKDEIAGASNAAAVILINQEGQQVQQVSFMVPDEPPPAIGLEQED